MPGYSCAMDDSIKPLPQLAWAAEERAAQGDKAGALAQARALLPQIAEASAAPLAEQLSALAERCGDFELALRFYQAFHRLSRQDSSLGTLLERAALDARWPALSSSGRPLCLALLEADQALGNESLEPALMQMVQLQRAQCRAHDLTLRHGTDRLLLVLLDIELAGARSACERVRRAVKAHDWTGLGTHPNGLSISIGFSALRGGEAFDKLLARAEAGLQAARREGRNCVRAGLLAD